MCALNWTGLRRDANQPIVLELKEYFPRIFPEIPKWQPSGLVGGYNPASVGGGHEYGLAADIYLRVPMENEKRVGDGLFDMFMWQADEVGVEHVIWNEMKWESKKNVPGAPRKFLGQNPHTDHVHVRFTREMSQRRPPILVFRLQRLHDELFPE
jgi:hypothetical protein